MGTVLWVILAIAIVIVAVIFFFALLVLLVPFRASARAGGSSRAGWDGAAKVSWLWGFVAAAYLFRERAVRFSLAGLRLFTVRPKPEKKKAREEPAKAVEPKKKKRSFPFTPRVMLSMARNTFRSLRPEGGFSAVVGTGDPAETGRLYGYLMSVLAPFSLPLEHLWQWSDDSFNPRHPAVSQNASVSRRRNTADLHQSVTSPFAGKPGTFYRGITVRPYFGEALFAGSGFLSVRVWAVQLASIFLGGYFRSRKLRKQRSYYAKHQGTA